MGALVQKDFFQDSNKLKISSKMKARGMDEAAVVRETSFALQIVENNWWQFQRCRDERTIINAIVNVASMGLTLNPAAQECYLMTRKISFQQASEYMAVAMPGYRGLYRLAIEAGGVTDIVCQVVREKDFFEWEPSNPIKPITHKPKALGGRGPIIGAYALLNLPDGSRKAEVLNMEQIEDVRECSDAYRNEKRKLERDPKYKPHGPWFKWEESMIRKTVLRASLKYAPRGKGLGQERLDKVIELDNQDFSMTMEQASKIDYLLGQNWLNDRERNAIEARLHNGPSHHVAKEIIKYIEAKDPGPMERQRAIPRKGEIMAAAQEAIDRPNT